MQSIYKDYRLYIMVCLVCFVLPLGVLYAIWFAYWSKP